MEIKCSEMSRKFFFAAIALLFFLAFNSLAFANHETDEINHFIKQKNARWKAGETSISKLPWEERRQFLGALIPDIGETTQAGFTENLTASEIVSAPTGLDWRNNNGGNYVTPIRNQSNCGSCWAFATTAALESQVLKTQNTPGVNINTSEQILVSCSGAGGCNGGYLGTASNYIRDVGLPLESCFPYTATDNSCTNACANWDDYTFGISGWHWVATTSPTVTAIKNALYTYGPLVTTFDVYSDFYSYTSGIYSYATGTYEGGHAVLIIGYDDSGQYFIVKNSWGTGWGESGFFRIAYSELASVIAFGEYTIAYEGYIPLPSPQPSTTTTIKPTTTTTIRPTTTTTAAQPTSTTTSIATTTTTICGYSISPASKSFKSSAGTGSVSVATQSGCAWTAASNNSWITLKSGMSGSGNGTVVYAISANTTASTRTGTVTIAGLTFTVKQQGARIKR